MNEVEKMYKLAQIANEGYDAWDMKDIYPPFTAEKQLELYKYLCKPFLITTRYYFDEFSITAENTFEWKTMTKVSVTGKTYEECIVKLVNNLWEYLTEEEKKQIAKILRGDL